MILFFKTKYYHNLTFLYFLIIVFFKLCNYLIHLKILSNESFPKAIIKKVPFNQWMSSSSAISFEKKKKNK